MLVKGLQGSAVTEVTDMVWWGQLTFWSDF